MFFLKPDLQQLNIRTNTHRIKMSSRTYNNNAAAKTTTAATGPYCKVCYDAGCSRTEYTGHYVKDQPGPDGKVVCPTLLNQSCRICGKTGHTSSYCSQYRARRQERYIEREPRREDRREVRYIEREQPPRHEVRYIEREPRRHDDRRDISYNRLHEDTERHEREVRERDDSYHREQDRRSKPWLQAALKPAQEQQERRQPYAHPHGPRIRLQLEAPALSVSTSAPSIELNLPKWGTPEYMRLFQTDDSNSSSIIIPALAPAIDVRKVELHHAANWGDEDTETPFVCDPEQMTRKFFEEEIMAGLTTKEEFDFIAMCDDQRQMPFECGE
jgi:hypothetical protein